MVDLKELFLHYGILLPKRYFRRQKRLYLTTLFQAMKPYASTIFIHQSKRKQVVENLMMNDIHQAKVVVIANYDTPPHAFGNPFVYYPFNGPSSLKKSIFSFYTPQLLSMAFSLYLLLFYVPKINFTTRPLFSTIILFLLILLFLLGYSLSFMVPNRINMNRNSSGVCTLLYLLQHQPAHTAYVLTDFGCTNHKGEALLRQKEPAIDTKTVLYLDCLGQGDTLMIGYQKAAEEKAKKLQRYLPNAKLCLLTPEELKYTSLSYYPCGLYLSKGNYLPDSKTIQIPNTCTNKDDAIDHNDIKAIVQGIVAYIEKEEL